MLSYEQLRSERIEFKTTMMIKGKAQVMAEEANQSVSKWIETLILKAKK